MVLIWSRADHMILEAPAGHILRKMDTPPKSSSTLYYEDIAFLRSYFRCSSRVIHIR